MAVMYVDMTGDRGKCPADPGLAGHVGSHVREDQPVLGSDHRELESGLQVRLVETGVDAVRVERFQVGIQVDATVGWVGEAVQALAAARVRALGHDTKFVDGL